MAKFAPGNPGKPVGAKNKVTQALREQILLALDESGGVEYLKFLAQKEPTAFAGLLGKVLPMQVTGEDGRALEITWRASSK